MAPLPLISEKRLPHAITGDLVSYCDPHDLVAIATDAQDVIVYRINGQVAFSVKRRDADIEVTALAWKQDGSILAVGWSDGVYGLYSGENGRAMSQSTIRDGANGSLKQWKLDLTPDFGGEDEDEEGGPVVTGFSFMRHSPPQPKGESGKTLETAMSELTTEDWADGLSEEPSENEPGGKRRGAGRKVSIEKLTRSIATLDVTTVLPRLSSIPSHGLRAGPDGSKFSSQAATDLAFETGKDASAEDVDSLLVCCSDGIVHVLIDDTVKIGTCRVNGKPLLSTSLANSSLHAVLSHDQDEKLHASLMDLPLETLSGSLLHTIATNTKRIQTLLAYVTHTIRCISHDYTTGLQFPTRLMSNIQTELSEKQEGDLITNLYHLSMTGNFSATTHEWLTDIVKETNHKRWHQAIDSMYTHIKDHLFINLKPALDRLSIATTELRGLARFHEGSTAFEVSPELFTKMLDGIDSLRVLSQKILLTLMTEHKQFKAFSKWLRVMVEIAAAEPGSKAACETEERENPNIDYPLVWDYIDSTLSKSKLARHVEPRPGWTGGCSSEEFFTKRELTDMSYERTLEAVTKLDKLAADEPLSLKGILDADALVNLPSLAVWLSGSVRLALERITEWQSKMLASPTSVTLNVEPSRTLDLQMSVGAGGKEIITILSQPRGSPSHLVVMSIDPSFTSDQTLGSPMTSSTYSGDFDILDAKFHGNSALLLDGSHAITPMDTSTLQTTNALLSLSVDLQPQKLVVGGRKAKQVCLVLGDREWLAFDLDFKTTSNGVEGTTDDIMSDADDAEMTL